MAFGEVTSDSVVMAPISVDIGVGSAVLEPLELSTTDVVPNTGHQLP
jgi:hypothetical protein